MYGCRQLDVLSSTIHYSTVFRNLSQHLLAAFAAIRRSCVRRLWTCGSSGHVSLVDMLQCSLVILVLIILRQQNSPFLH